MAEYWTDQHGQKWEMKTENGKQYYRRPGQGEDKWKEGMPPGWAQRPMRPLSSKGEGQEKL